MSKKFVVKLALGQTYTLNGFHYIKGVSYTVDAGLAKVLLSKVNASGLNYFVPDISGLLNDNADDPEEAVVEEIPVESVVGTDSVVLGGEEVVEAPKPKHAPNVKVVQKATK